MIIVRFLFTSCNSRNPDNNSFITIKNQAKQSSQCEG